MEIEPTIAAVFHHKRWLEAFDAAGHMGEAFAFGDIPLGFQFRQTGGEEGNDGIFPAKDGAPLVVLESHLLEFEQCERLGCVVADSRARVFEIDFPLEVVQRALD
jgi:hypothetical protein